MIGGCNHEKRVTYCHNGFNSMHLCKDSVEWFYGSTFLIMLTTVLFTGCSVQTTMTLMPTPVIYQDSAIDPYAHLDDARKSTRTKIYYATNRRRNQGEENVSYGNSKDSSLHLGTAVIRMGDNDESWEDIYDVSRTAKQEKPVTLILEDVTETAVMDPDLASADSPLSAELQSFVDAINSELDGVLDKEIMVYVHGTKVDFANSAILTAEIDHFAGRDFAALAFAWPSHQNIVSYLTGVDVRRARQSSGALANLLVFLAEHTRARQINVLSYSAGGKVATKALLDLREQYSHLDSAGLRKKFRLGSVVFAAIDVEVDTFLERIAPISELSEQVVLTVTDDDNALKAARVYMGGEVRAGSAKAEQIEEQYIVSHQLSNVEIVDVSYGKEVRGFDITGHHYWYRHPWMSSDIIFLMRTNLPPSRRGLSAAELEGIWYLSPEYPDKIRQAAETELKGQW